MANSKRKCPCCGEYNRPEEGVLINDRLYCSYDHASKYAASIRLKGKAIREKADRAETKKRKADLLTRSDWIKKVKKACHTYIRLRDQGKKCVTCDTVLVITGKAGGDYDAGHYRSVGSAKHMEFHTLNIHGQCKKCNRFGFDKDVYTEELIKRIGPDLVEKVNSDQRERKYTIPDLIRLEKIFKDKAKAFKERKACQH